MPLEISGSAVAAASTVAPKITPCTPIRSASTLPAYWSATPAPSVTTKPARTPPATNAVGRPESAAAPFLRLRRSVGPAGVPGLDDFHSRLAAGTRLRIQRRPSQETTTAIDAGLTPPISSRREAPPPSTLADHEHHGQALDDRHERPDQERERLLAVMRPPSHTTSTSVWMAIPPIRLPAASPRWPWLAADTVIAISGRLPAIASRIIPPCSSPSPRRRSSESVVLERKIPASQVAPAPATKTSTRSGVERPLTHLAYDPMVPRS